LLKGRQRQQGSLQGGYQGSAHEGSASHANDNDGHEDDHNFTELRLHQSRQCEQGGL
jgi:hypothetical protein